MTPSEDKIKLSNNMEEVLHVNSPPKEPWAALSGLPGLGAVGAGAASLFLERSNIKPLILKHLFAGSSYANLIVSERNVISPGGFTLFYSEIGEKNLPIVVLVGAFQPFSPLYQFDFAKLYLSTVKEMGSMYAFTLGGYHSAEAGTERRIFILPNDFQTYRASLGLNFVLAGGQISGAAGVISGLSKYFGFKGGCLLAETNGEVPDKLASLSLYEGTLRLLQDLHSSSY